MLTSWKKFFVFYFVTLFTSTAFASLQFASAEHITIGDQVKLYFSLDDIGNAGTLLTLPNGLQLTYGDIIALGDFYGIVGQPISQGETEAERKLRFITGFNSFALDSFVIKEATQLVNVMHAEKQQLEEGLNRGESSESIYAKLSDQTNRQYNCITGGGCDFYWFLTPGRSMQLAFYNYDHFGNNAWIAYQTGHDLAIEQAIIAHNTHDKNLLTLAYAMNAFASHFLTDRFASGHIRTPRVELVKQVTPSVVGNILASFMHNEENPVGIHVHNLRGDQWILFGDYSYFNPQNKIASEILTEAVQASAFEVFAAYLSGVKPPVDALIPIIPFPDEVNNAAKLDISSLFYWDEHSQTLMRRKDLANEFDRHWTKYWWGWSTLIELSEVKGIPLLLQAQLARSDYSYQAVRDGLITDKVIINYVKHAKH